MLLAVRCGAHLISKLLAVERFVRYNDAGGALQSAESINCFFLKGEGGELAHKLCCVQRSVRAYLRPNNSICACSNAGEHYIIF